MDSLLGMSSAALSLDRVKLQHRSRCPLLPNRSRGTLKITANARKEANAATGESGNPSFPSKKGSSTPASIIDRRELLAGTIAGGASLAASPTGPALAEPVGSPTFKRCQPANIANTNTFVACCPPKPKRDTIDFKPDTGPMRTRPAAHLVDEDYIQKYNEAYAKMRALPSDDPRSFRQQANVHCVYCNFGYRQEGDPKSTLQIHFNWLFLPWHRWYLYYHEKILGSLINDPTFALPFWNWDNQEGGSYIPEMFRREGTPIFDANRNEANYAPARVDLGYAPGVDPSFGEPTYKTDDQIRQDNISVMYNNVAKVKLRDAFFGAPIRKGNNNGADGSLEKAPHTAVHIFGGSPNNPNGEDLGNFYSAGKDPLFYCHHGNVDRMWDVWRSLGNQDFTDADYLNTEFLFFDENQDLVRVKVKDSIDNQTKLKYKYASMPQDKVWINYKPLPLAKTAFAQPKSSIVASLVPGATAMAAEYPLVKSSSQNAEPVKVGAGPLTITVAQPKGSASDELLVLEEMVVGMQNNTNFNVFINLPEANETTTLSCAEYVGSFYNIPHFMPGMTESSTRTTNARFSIKPNVEILGLKDADKLVVTLVPRGKDKEKVFTFKGASIEYA
ncbi:polyphenol oxidase I, chloroplastic [Selaginella moellendorffii]|uniref:polyphenol oxidase I, chloroplastic n=1 Tax=Selaginella moellendorffii TaxID=88036 RepID=UPI000D1CD169|nr:polyphenol oxidase I, chloroplastic [Selaginella moellendorffii]|eukprot:XP_024541491.1 polyphenol oxidase I, chloroplastic [Selaginella moellendorffii]